MPLEELGRNIKSNKYKSIRFNIVKRGLQIKLLHSSAKEISLSAGDIFIANKNAFYQMEKGSLQHTLSKSRASIFVNGHLILYYHCWKTMYSTLKILPSAFRNAPEYPSKINKLFISWSCAWELHSPQIVCNKLFRVHLTDTAFVKRLCRCCTPHTENVVSLTDMFWHPSGWLQNSTWSRIYFASKSIGLILDPISVHQKTVLQHHLIFILEKARI